MQKMNAEWIRIVASGLAGFIGASVVQLLVLRWQESTQKKLLRKSLYTELAAIYSELRDLLPRLRTDGPARLEPNPANLPAFVNADCFSTAKSSATFWRLRDALGIVQAHRNFGFLAVSKPSDVRSAANDVGQVLNVFRGLFDSAQLCRRDLVTNADGQVTEAELTAVSPSTTGVAAQKAWYRKGFTEFGSLGKGAVVLFWAGVVAWLLIAHHTRRKAASGVLLVLVLIGFDLVQSTYKQRAEITANRGALVTVGVYAALWIASLISMAYLVDSLTAVVILVGLALTMRLVIHLFGRSPRAK